MRNLVTAALIAIALTALSPVTANAHARHGTPPGPVLPMAASHKGLGPGVAVPAWAKDKRIHFLPSESDKEPAETTHNKLGRECVQSYSTYCPKPPLLYRGGNVQHSPHVYAIFWGTNWATEPGLAVRTGVTKFFESLSGSSYQGILGQYFDSTGYIGSNVALTTYNDTSVAAPAGVGDPQIEEEVARAVKANGWIRDANAQFVVLPAPGTAYTWEGSTGFCAYHSVDAAGSSYTFLPFPGNAPFGGPCVNNSENSSAHAAGMWASHEYAESASDPKLSSWKTYDGYEIADICSSGDDELPSGVWVQGLWDDHEHACVLSGEHAPQVLGFDADPSNLSAVGATLHAQIYPEGLKTEYSFEVGPTTSYGASWPVPKGSLELGTAIDSSKEIAVGVGNLEPGKNYHYRLVATNSTGTYFGEDHMFRPSYWKNEATPKLPEGEGRYAMVATSCGSATFCLTVGEVASKPAAEAWYGKGWTLNTPRTPVGSVHAGLEGVSCTSSTACVAVGTFRETGSTVTKPLAEAWNGSEWALVGVPIPTGTKGDAVLKSVSCASAGSCVAVGGYVSATEPGEPIEERPLVETWNGTTWSVQAAPNQAGTKFDSFRSVSCATASVCTAVGQAGKSPLVERLSGGVWTVETASAPAGATESTFTAVSCASTTTCVAVGNANTNGGSLQGSPVGFTESWAGAGWQSQASGASGPLESVACLSPSSCETVGGTSGLRWNGKSWSSSDNVALPPAETQYVHGGSQQVEFKAVACASGWSCVAVGDYFASGGYVAMADSLGPHWSTQTSANPKSPVSSSLFKGVSCPSASSCYAVGDGAVSGSSFVDSRSGGEWKLGETLSGNAQAISCKGSLCMAVGTTSPGVLHAWRLTEGELTGNYTPPLPTGANSAQLRSVSCSAESACTAVGDYYFAESSEWKTLVERWNGSSWSLQTAVKPAEGGADKAMLALSCAGASSCMTVGEAASKPTAELWNGSEWSLKTPLFPAGAHEATLEGVSCATTSSCIAVGSYREATGFRKTLVESWNGSAWTIQSSPNPAEAQGDVQLRSVSCLSATSCVAAGGYVSVYQGGEATEERTLAESLSGSSWAIQPTPNPTGAKFSSLQSISCTSATACSAVGGSSPGPAGEQSVTLAEGYE